ncbi:MAG TPA: hypothetical protein VK911_16765 [Vicinamibacterales bacterium]|nr:hypothetical protein [Vicinamibacterales bacterium]
MMVPHPVRLAAAALALCLPLVACSSPASPVAPETPEAPAAAPPPAARESYPGTGPEVVAYVAQRYPERLVGGISFEQRQANVEFLRDKVIEVGICGGMNLAWNLKRGVGPRSIDAIDWRHGVQDINDVVDFALSWKDPSRPLQLQWLVVGGPAGWDPFPTPTCR